MGSYQTIRTAPERRTLLETPSFTVRADWELIGRVIAEKQRMARPLHGARPRG